MNSSQQKRKNSNSNGSNGDWSQQWTLWFIGSMFVAINKIRESEPQVDYIILPKQAVSLIYLPSKDLH